jgi:regulatory protein
MRFARRRKLGPFAAGSPDPQARQKALGAMMRAGHPFELARAILSLEPGAEPDDELLRKFT